MKASNQSTQHHPGQSHPPRKRPRRLAAALLVVAMTAAGGVTNSQAESVQIECEKMRGDGINMHRSGAENGLTRRLAKPGHRIEGEFKTSVSDTFYAAVALSHRGRPIKAELIIDHRTNEVVRIRTTATRKSEMEVARSWNEVHLFRSLTPLPMKAGQHEVELVILECDGEGVEFDFVRIETEAPKLPELPIVVEAEAEATEGETMLRSEASGKATRLLKPGDAVAVIPFVSAGAEAAELVVRYSNDSSKDIVEVALDDPDKTWRFTAETTRRPPPPGTGWNEFQTHRLDLGKLEPGAHVIIIRLIKTDPWGLELDNVEIVRSAKAKELRI